VVVRFGISVGNSGRFGVERGIDACLELARRAEGLGYDSVWVNDHIVLPRQPRTPYPYSPDGAFLMPWNSEFHEPLIVLSALAAVTQRVELGTSVLVVPYRHPAVTAKMLATTDLLSGGRVVLGAGVGWLRDEFEALGLPAAHFEHRGGVTEDYLRAIKEMWTNTGPSRYTGTYVSFRDVGTFPKPARRPHPPIVIGGKGVHALRRAVLLGDGFQALMSDVDELAAEVEGLRRWAKLDRRDPGELEVQLARPVQLHERPIDGTRAPLAGSIEQVCEDLRGYARAGLCHLIGTPALAGAGDAWEQTVAGTELFAREVLPAFGAGARA
jgi:probable F420-dependent oxidoreductase